MTLAPELEPLLPSEQAIFRSDLPYLALGLEPKAAALAGGVSPVAAWVLEKHMRVIHSYYSNLIEGNATHPREIRQAMAGDYSQDPAKCDLQLESVAHIAVQDAIGTGEDIEDILNPDTFRLLHRCFFEKMPESMRTVRSGDGEQTRLVEPGRFRQPGEHVNVGRHVAPQPEELERLLERYREAYQPARLKGHLRVIAAMAAHHRFAWIHPFLDGNGRVARLHTDSAAPGCRCLRHMVSEPGTRPPER
jgi:Fic family protein